MRPVGPTVFKFHVRKPYEHQRVIEHRKEVDKIIPERPGRLNPHHLNTRTHTHTHTHTHMHLRASKSTRQTSRAKQRKQRETRCTRFPPRSG